MEILKRAKGFQSGEGVSWTENPENVREEVVRRGYKAGHCNKEGGPLSSGKIRSFGGLGETKLNIWPRDSEGNLIE